MYESNLVVASIQDLQISHIEFKNSLNPWGTGSHKIESFYAGTKFMGKISY